MNLILKSKMKLTCKLGSMTKIVEAYPSDQLNVLIQKLNLHDKNTKFIYRGITYSVGSIQTFDEIGLTSNNYLMFTNQAIAG
jgi:hypothetical protein